MDRGSAAADARDGGRGHGLLAAVGCARVLQHARR